MRAEKFKIVYQKLSILAVKQISYNNKPTNMSVKNLMYFNLIYFNDLSNLQVVLIDKIRVTFREKWKKMRFGYRFSFLKCATDFLNTFALIDVKVLLGSSGTKPRICPTEIPISLFFRPHYPNKPCRL